MVFQLDSKSAKVCQSCRSRQELSKKEAKRAAPGRRQKASSGDQGAQNTKQARVAPKKKKSEVRVILVAQWIVARYSSGIT